MREVILLRHAEALPTPVGKPDIERQLSPHGEAQARAAAVWLASAGASPDCVLCSPALRARQTAALALGAQSGITAQLEPVIYEATPAELIDLLDEHADAACVMLVGHNPGLERLLALLTEGRSDEPRGLPAAAIARLAVTQLEPGGARVSAYWSP